MKLFTQLCYFVNMEKVCLPVLLTLCLIVSCSGLIDIRYTGLRVSLHVFSGIRDPVWNFHLGDPNFRLLQTRLQGHHSTTLASRLGYSGFSIVFIRGNSEYTMDIGRCSDPDTERFLLDHVINKIPEGAQQPLSDTVVNYVRTDMESCGH